MRKKLCEKKFKKNWDILWRFHEANKEVDQLKVKFYQRFSLISFEKIFCRNRKKKFQEFCWIPCLNWLETVAKCKGVAPSRLTALTFAPLSINNFVIFRDSLDAEMWSGVSPVNYKEINKFATWECEIRNAILPFWFKVFGLTPTSSRRYNTTASIWLE